MTMSLMQVLVALAMVGVAVVLIFTYRGYLASNSERRMRSMLASVGLDPEIAASGEIPTIMKDVRERCQTCSSEAVCEEWLSGANEDGNDFCPNHRVFEILKKYSRPAASD